ncbi:PAS domain S-box protein [Belliella sp. R4-6]|uniref:PAS domain S-box protein n=1 Tax=Belliella alkalica TaxID=1730871 RepID=A0ABS9V759_9BACT|nr:PAS domain S-box protein [Belliella alkalica]MCH7412263.1 PAS domain S-box protein [Belliella alkalica]
MTDTESSKKILIIEDNIGDFVLISEYLEEVFEKLIIDQAKTFKDFLSKVSNEYDIILLDLSLPDKDGENLVNEVLKFAENIPVIVLTGYSDKVFAIKSISLGTADYLLKDEIKPDILQKSIIYAIERKKVFNQLEDSEKRYRELFHLSPLPMYVFDKTSFKFLDVNRTAISHYGYSKEDFLDMTVFDIRPENEKARALDIISRTNEGPEMKNPGTFKHIKKNGELIDVEISYNEIEFKGRKALLVLANDVTLKYQYIDAIETQNTKLKEIAWIQSHVVRAPLARLMGLVNLISLEGEDPGFSKEDIIKHIANSTQELDMIIRNITNKTEQINIDDIQ